MEDVIKPYKSQLENSPSQPENTSTQPIPISIDINDLVDEYAGVDKRENRQNKRDRRIKIPSYKARQNMISINKIPKSSDTNIVPFITANITQILLNKSIFTQILEPLSIYKKALNRPDAERWIVIINI